MSPIRQLPSIRNLLLQAEETNAQIIGAPYAQWNCWHLCRYLFREGWGLDLDQDPHRNVQLVEEVWWKDDAADVMTMTQPWDIWVFNFKTLVASHLGIVMDSEQLVHTSEQFGVTLEKLKRWQPHLLLIYRLRQLL